MPMPSDPQAAAYVAYIISQTEQNIDFLASQNVISPADASEISSRLSASQANLALSNGMHSLAIAAPPSISPAASVSPPPRRVPPPPARTQRARALWAYNENGQEPNDLCFSSGEIVEIIDETNTDWWTGRCRGRQGLFPSNHVEKLNSAASPPPPAPVPTPSPMSMPLGPPMGVPMQPAPSYVPPESEKQLYQPYPMQPPAPMPPPQDPPPKKHRFGNLGNTMAQSAAGGVGFGAGAAIGSGIVNAIF